MFRIVKQWFAIVVFFAGLMLLAIPAYAAPLNGAIVRQGSYEFCYNKEWDGFYDIWVTAPGNNGWGARYSGPNGITQVPALPDMVQGYPVTNITELFYGYGNVFEHYEVKSINPNFKTTYIKKASFAFHNMGFTSLPAGMTFPVLEDGGYTFVGNKFLGSLPSGMLLPNLKSGDNMFAECVLAALPANMKLPNLLDGDGMFNGCKLTSLPTGMTLDNLEDGFGMFGNCSLTTLPGAMRLPRLAMGGGMFYQNKLTTLPNGMALQNLTYGDAMFESNPLTSLPTGLLLDKLKSGNDMFYENRLTSLPAGMTLSNLRYGRSMFRENPLVALPEGMLLNDLTNGWCMFGECKLTTLPSKMVLSKVENGSNMFASNPLRSLPEGINLSSLSQDEFAGFNMFRDIHTDTKTFLKIPDGFKLSTLYDSFKRSSVRFNRSNQSMLNYAKAYPSGTGEDQPRLWSTQPAILKITEAPNVTATNVTLTVSPDFLPATPHPSGAYSFDGGATWQAGNSKVFTSNQTIKVVLREAGGLTTSQTVNITKVGKPPVIKSVTGNPTKVVPSAVIVINAEFGFPTTPHAQAYSFDGGLNWQTSNSKKYTENGWVKVRVRNTNEQTTSYPDFEITKLLPEVELVLPDGDRGVTGWTDREVVIKFEIQKAD